MNCDKVNFCNDLDKQRVIFKSGFKHPENILDSNKTNGSVMMAGTATDFLLIALDIGYRAENMRSYLVRTRASESTV